MADIGIQGVVFEKSGEIEIPGGPPFLPQVQFFQWCVGKSPLQDLSPAGIDFLGGHAGLVAEKQSVFQHLVIIGGKGIMVIVRVYRVKIADIVFNL